MNPRLLIPVCLLSCLLAWPAIAQLARAVDAKRGVSSSIELSHAPGTLRARAIDADAPLLLRVERLADDRTRVEFFPLRTGEFDLAQFIERVDGTPAVITSGVTRINVTSQLPPDAGTNIFESPRDPLALATRYRAAIVLFVLLWVLIPLIIYVRSVLRRPPPAVVVPPAPEPTLLDRARIALARGDQLTTSERAELELLLLRHMRSNAAADSAAAISRAVSELRTAPNTSQLVAHLERWLHAGDETQRQQAMQSVAQYLREHGGAA